MPCRVADGAIRIKAINLFCEELVGDQTLLQDPCHLICGSGFLK